MSPKDRYVFCGETKGVRRGEEFESNFQLTLQVTQLFAVTPLTPNHKAFQVPLAQAETDESARYAPGSVVYLGKQNRVRCRAATASNTALVNEELRLLFRAKLGILTHWCLFVLM